MLPIFPLILFLLLVAQPVNAYIGPGAGLGVIGTVIALLAAIIFAIIGFIWYPIKRKLLHRNKVDLKDEDTALENVEDNTREIDNP